MSKYGVYLISDPAYSKQQIITAISSGVKYFQLRCKNLTTDQFIELGLEYKQICKQHNVKLIINDNLEVAQAIDADGLHIGQDDISLEQAKSLFPGKIIGVSCTTLEQAKKARDGGATYIGVGAMYPTKTKLDAKLTSHTELIEMSKLKIDIVIIGGLTSVNIKPLLEYCDGVAVCSDILGSDNPQLQVKRYVDVMNQNINQK